VRIKKRLGRSKRPLKDIDWIIWKTVNMAKSFLCYAEKWYELM
jgi:hypothetical protein